MHLLGQAVPRDAQAHGSTMGTGRKMAAPTTRCRKRDLHPCPGARSHRCLGECVSSLVTYKSLATFLKPAGGTQVKKPFGDILGKKLLLRSSHSGIMRRARQCSAMVDRQPWGCAELWATAGKPTRLLLSCCPVNSNCWKNKGMETEANFLPRVPESQHVRHWKGP